MGNGGPWRKSCIWRLCSEWEDKGRALEGQGRQPTQWSLLSSCVPQCHTPPKPHWDLCPSLADASDLQGRQLLAGLDKVARDLERQEKAITGILRPPLEQGRAVQDSAERAKELKVLPAWGTGCA